MGRNLGDAIELGLLQRLYPAIELKLSDYGWQAYHPDFPANFSGIATTPLGAYGLFIERLIVECTGKEPRGNDERFWEIF